MTMRRRRSSRRRRKSRREKEEEEEEIFQRSIPDVLSFSLSPSLFRLLSLFLLLCLSFPRYFLLPRQKIYANTWVIYALLGLSSDTARSEVSEKLGEASRETQPMYTNSYE